MKKPFLNALAAVLYVVVIVLVIHTFSSALQDKNETVIIPMTMLSLLILSAAIMGFLFLSEPLRLFLENRKQEAIAFFTKTVTIFACFVAVFVALLFLV